MRPRSAATIGALAALLLALGIVACGGDDASDGAATGSVQEQTSQDGSSGDSRVGDSGEAPGATAQKEPAGKFKPRQHDDSAGGSGQFRVKGGDNSVQEFGTEAGEGEFEAAAAALHNFLDARADGYWAAACDYVAGSVVESFEKLASRSRRLEPGGCAAILAELTDPATVGALRKEAARADARSLRTEGRRAFLIYTGAADEVMAFPMVRRNGRWRVAGIAAVPVG